VVSYSSDAAPVRNIIIDAPVVVGTSHTRGIVVAGGDTIVIRNFNVSTNAVSGLSVGAQGDPFFTAPTTNNVWVDGDVITGGNFAAGIYTNAVTVYNSNPNAAVSNVTIQNASIVNPYNPYFNIAHITDNGAVLSNIVYRTSQSNRTRNCRSSTRMLRTPSQSRTCG
jgi:hypothetical protein